MSKPLGAIYVHFLDYYHANRAVAQYLATNRRVNKEAHLAFRMAVLFADTAIVPASSYFESSLCKRVLSRYPDFRYYGAVKLSARDMSLAEHIESKRAAYDDRSPEELVKAYRLKNRAPFPGYVRKRSSSTERITCGWQKLPEKQDPRRALDPSERLELDGQLESLWPRVPEFLGNRAFVPSHVADTLEEHGIILPSEAPLNEIIEPLYIDGYCSDFGASVIADLPTLTSPFEAGLLGRDRISFTRTAEWLERLHLLDAMESAPSKVLFRLRCHSQWDILAADILRDDANGEASERRADLLIRGVLEDRAGSRSTTTRAVQMKLPVSDVQDVTIGIVTALPEEFVAVEHVLEDPEPYQTAGDPNRYQLGSIPTDSGIHRLALVQLARMGNDSAASGSTNVLRTFQNIRLLVFCGIALGIPNPGNAEKHVRLGDIIVSDRRGVIQFDHVARKQGAVENRSNLPPPSAAATRAVNSLEQAALKGEHRWHTVLDEIISALPEYRRPDPQSDVLLDSSGNVIAHPDDPERHRCPDRPKVHRGAIGSGNALIRDPIYRDEMRDQHGLLAIEMEGAGTAEGAWQFDKYYTVIRAACDYGSPKNDLWHRYASAVAAAYTRAVLERLAL